MTPGMAQALADLPTSDQTIWILGESDDLLIAAFTTEAAARAWPTAHTISFDYPSHHWLEEIALDPTNETPTPSDSPTNIPGDGG